MAYYLDCFPSPNVTHSERRALSVDVASNSPGQAGWEKWGALWVAAAAVLAAATGGNGSWRPTFNS